MRFGFRGRRATTREFTCSDCGASHRRMPLSFHAVAPAHWDDDMAGAEGCELAEDACVIHQEHFFIRGLVRVPILGHAEPFEWGVWVSLSEEKFWQTMDTWETPGREVNPPMFGWLSTELPTYAEPTLDLRTQVHLQPVGLRPHIELEPSDHPLAVEQRRGISYAEATRRVELLMQQD